MRTTVQVSMVGGSQELHARLRDIYPSYGLTRSSYMAELDLEDQRLADIEHILRENGYSRWPGTRERKFASEYSVNYIREYDESDWKRAEFLEIVPKARIARLGIRNGHVQLPGLDLKPDEVRVASAFYQETIMPERWKLKLQERQLLGVEFRQTEIIAHRTEEVETERRMAVEDLSPYQGEPWWELYSVIELPPVSDTMTLEDPKHQRHGPGEQRWKFRREQPYNHAELHYRRIHVKRFPSFDLARTWEEWAGDPALVASKRFFEACRDIGLDMGWVPVRIDPD